MSWMVVVVEVNGECCVNDDDVDNDGDSGILQHILIIVNHEFIGGTSTIVRSWKVNLRHY